MKRLLLVAVIALLALPAPAGLPVTVQPDNPDIVKMGRFSKDHQFGWTAAGFRFKMNATDVDAVLKLTASRAGAVQVVVDGKPTEVIQLKRDQTVYPLARDLPAGEHTIEVWKRTEGFLGQVQLVELKLNAGAKLLPLKAHDRKILVIGDSISCGYGNEAKEMKEGNTPENENGYMAYGPLAARELNAEVMMVCWSGKGVYRDRSEKNDQATTIPKIFDRALPLSDKAVWDHSRYVPDVIVINLGTNDLFRGKQKQKPELTKEMYLGAYRDFIKQLEALYPKAKIIAAFGPMAQRPITEWLPELAKEDKKVSVLIWTYPEKDRQSYIGGHWHPSVKMNELMGRELAAKIREVMGWR